MASFNSDLKQLEKQLGHQFQDANLLLTALTHSSSQADRHKSNEDNERLEFLGDRVLGLSICAHLMQAYPLAREGELARRYNRLVRRQMCTKVATEIQLGSFLILSTGEDHSGGRQKSTILANAMEALLGAIFIDAGYKKAHEVISHLWKDHLQEGDETLIDPKTALQEWAQGQGFDLPRYEQVSRQGPDHQPIFIYQVTVQEKGTATGQGASKRIAEQNAAKALLEQNKVWETSS